MGPWLIRIFDIVRGDGGLGGSVTPHVFGNLKAARDKAPRRIDLIAYRRHIRWGQLEEDSRNAAPNFWTHGVNGVTVRPLSFWSDFVGGIESRAYGEEDLGKCNVCGAKVGIPAPDQMPPMDLLKRNLRKMPPHRNPTIGIKTSTRPFYRMHLHIWLTWDVGVKRKTRGGWPRSGAE